jgi:hypothetical protein
MTDICDFCDRKQKKETLNEPGMTWLQPDDCWICTECLRNKKKKILFKI